MVRIPAAIGNIEEGHIFIPFHYGYWDEEECRPRAANELTIPLWDPISKQPYFKTAAARLEKVGDEPAAPTPCPPRKGEETPPREEAKPAPRPHVADYLSLLLSANIEFEHACDTVSGHHAKHLEIVAGLKTLRSYSEKNEAILKPFLEKYGQQPPVKPEALRSVLFERRPGEFGIIRDLHDLYLMASNAFMAATIVHHAAEGLHDAELLSAVTVIVERARTQSQWAKTHLQHQSSHALVVPS
jgi:hypothetical protein